MSRVSALHLLVLKDRLFFFADTMVNIDPSAAELAEIACLAADTARVFDIEPRVAMLSFSSFGSVRHAQAERVAEAADLVRQMRPALVVDGEMHLDTAVVEEIVRENYPHSRIRAMRTCSSSRTLRPAYRIESWSNGWGRPRRSARF